MSGFCKFCKYFNRFDLTYIEQRVEVECCAYWHIEYWLDENAGDRKKECFVEKDLFDL